MKEQMNYEIDYQTYGKLVEDFIMKVWKQHKAKPWTHIVGIPMGGLPIAVAVAHNLDRPLVHMDYAWLTKDVNLLVVDDILDTGETYNRWKQTCFLKDENFAFLFARSQWRGNIRVVIGTFLNRPEPVRFPWEEEY